MKIRSSALLLLLTALLPAGNLALAGSTIGVLVCYSGGTVNQNDANAAMGSMLRVVERVGQWPKNRFASTFTANADECGKQLQEQPQFAITSLGLYLDRRAADHWVPLVQPRINGRTTERYRVVVRKGSFSDLTALKDRSLGGTTLDDRDFVARIVFAGKIALTDFDLRPSHLAIRMLRGLDSGELDAALLNQQQFTSLDSLNLKNPMDVIFTSEEIPMIGVVANTKVSTPEDRARFTQALESMCGDAEGKKLCDLFGVESFVAVNPHVYDGAIRLWERGG